LNFIFQAISGRYQAMAYSDFTLGQLKEKFGIRFNEAKSNPISAIYSFVNQARLGLYL